MPNIAAQAVHLHTTGIEISNDCQLLLLVLSTLKKRLSTYQDNQCKRSRGMQILSIASLGETTQNDSLLEIFTGSFTLLQQ